MKKRVFSLLFCFILILGITGCGKINAYKEAAYYNEGYGTFEFYDGFDYEHKATLKSTDLAALNDNHEYRAYWATVKMKVSEISNFSDKITDNGGGTGWQGRIYFYTENVENYSADLLNSIKEGDSLKVVGKIARSDSSFGTELSSVTILEVNGKKVDS